jgi:hypothetical protein
MPILTIRKKYLSTRQKSQNTEALSTAPSDAVLFLSLRHGALATLILRSGICWKSCSNSFTAVSLGMIYAVIAFWLPPRSGASDT